MSQPSVYAMAPPRIPHGTPCSIADVIVRQEKGVTMALHLGLRKTRMCAAAFAIVVSASPAAAQPKLESSSLGHWRGYWMSTRNPAMQGPVEQFIDTERNRRVHGSMEWNTAGGLLLELDLAGTTSASCHFNYVLTGRGAS